MTFWVWIVVVDITRTANILSSAILLDMGSLVLMRNDHAVFI